MDPAGFSRHTSTPRLLARAINNEAMCAIRLPFTTCSYSLSPKGLLTVRLVFELLANTKLEHTTASHSKPPGFNLMTYFNAKVNPERPDNWRAQMSGCATKGRPPPRKQKDN